MLNCLIFKQALRPSVLRSLPRGVSPVSLIRPFTHTCSKFNAQKPPSNRESNPHLNELKQKINSSQDSKPVKVIDNIYTIPNFLTMTRIATAPMIGYYFYTGQTTIAFSLFTYSCVTDFLDGFIARTFNMKSILGTILDPIADKLLMGISTISLSLVGIMPGYLGALIIGKDAMLAAMGVYYRYVTLPKPKTWSRFANLSIPTVVVEPNMLSKVNTALQMVYIGYLVVQTQFEQLTEYSEYLGYFEMIVAATTLLSGASYLLSKKSVKALGDKLNI